MCTLNLNIFDFEQDRGKVCTQYVRNIFAVCSQYVAKIGPNEGVVVCCEGEVSHVACLQDCLIACMLGCLLATLLGWLVGWLAGWLVGWLVG